MESQDVKIEPSAMFNSSYETAFIDAGYNSCGGGVFFQVGLQQIELTESAETFRELLIANKTSIEAHTINYSFTSSDYDFYQWLLTNDSETYANAKLSDFMQCIKD